MKGETVHAVFAEVKQQRAEQDQQRPRRDPAKQEGQCLHGRAHHQRGNASVTKEYEKHVRFSSGLGRNGRTQSYEKLRKFTIASRRRSRYGRGDIGKVRSAQTSL